MAKGMKRLRMENGSRYAMENGSRGPSDDGMSAEETAPRTRCSEGRRNTGRKKVKMMLVKVMEETSETRKLLESHIESNNNQNKIFGKYLEKLTEYLQKLSESHNDPRKQLELHTNIPRSQWNQEQQPRYQLVLSKMDEKIEKGKPIEIHVALVDFNSKQTVKNGPLASATVELVVIDAKFNKNNNQHNWSVKDFRSNIKTSGKGNSATVDVDESGISIVSNGRFNLENGEKHHCDFSVFRNSGNSRFKLGVMVVSTTQERVLEGLSNPFFVRGHDRNRMQARVGNDNQEQNGPISIMQNPPFPNSTQADGNVQAQVDNSNQEQNGPISNMQNPSCPNSTQSLGNVEARDDNGNQEQNGPVSTQNTSCPNSTQAYGNAHAWVQYRNQEQNGPMPNMENPSFPILTQADRNGWLERQHQSRFQRTTPLFSTDSATCQQHQVPHRSMMAEARNNPNGVHDGFPGQHGPMPNMHNPLWQNPTQGLDTNGQAQFGFIRNTDATYTEPSASLEQDLWSLINQPTNSGTGAPFYTYQRTFPVRILNMPSVVPSKHCFNLFDHLMPLHSGQPNFKNCGLPTTRLMQEHFGSLTTMPKEFMQTRRERGVLIEPLEPDDSDEGRPLKRKLHSKYKLRFVNEVCETYYTGDQIKAVEGNLLRVSLFDENNIKITSGPLSSASVEVVTLHGDFNCDGQDYWTSEEFIRSVVCPPPGEEASSVLGGDRILVLSGGEACLGDAFFQTTSFCARTGLFKMGVMLLASAQEERIQEGISEAFRVMDHSLAGDCGRVFGKRPEEDSASIIHPSVVRASMWHLLSLVKASSHLLDHYKVMEGMEKQQKDLECMLLEILGIIEDAQEKGAFHDVAAPWLNDLEKVAYEADDIFEEFKYEALRREAKKGHHSMLGMDILRDRNPIVFRYRMSKKLCKIVKTIKVLVTEMKALGFRHTQQAPPSKQLMKTEPILFDSDMDMVRRSRDKEKNKIIGMLLHEASNMDLVVLPIVGFGGIGKTTLAQSIYNDPEIEKHFELQRWCHVSDDFDFTNIANNICQTKVNDQGCEKALKDLQSILSGKRYLIVLDDVWNRDEAKWGELMTCLMQGGKGSAVLATTREEEVARIMKMGVAESCYIEKLSPKHLKEIIQSRAFSLQKPNSDELDGIVDTFVDRCEGCPLAAKTLGSLLSTKTSLEEWKDILDSDLWNDENSGILTSLKLSFVHLPPDLKQCFIYCSIFPRNYQIERESLVQQWMALGFISVQEDDHPETLGEEIFKELTWRSFFEEVKQRSLIEYGKRLQLRNETTYHMHDLLHKLARYDAWGECFTTDDKPSTKKLLPNTTQHLFLSSRGTSRLDDFSNKEFPMLQTLFCADNASTLLLSKYTSLRVLHLPQLEHHGVELSHLSNLRYLNLSESPGLTELPNNISRLSKLQTLDISYCTNLRQLPKDMKNMSSLRHLYTNGCKSLVCMPPGLGQLTLLRTITYFVVGAGSGCSTIRELQNLNLGGELELNCLQNATEEHAKAASLENKWKLTHLSLRWNSESQEAPVQHCPKVLNALKPPSGLQMLRIIGYEGNCLPSWTTDLSQLQHLTEFHLVSLVSCKEFPQFCQLNALRILYLKKLDKLQSLCSHVVSMPFPKLRVLRLHDLEILEKWVATEGKGEEFFFPVLEKIVIKNCPKLTHLPEAPKLKHIELDEGKSVLIKLRRMSSLSTLVQLPTQDIEATRPHQKDQNPDSCLSELNLKRLLHEDRDVSHPHSSNPHKVSQGTMHGLEFCFAGSSSDRGRCHSDRDIKSYEGERTDEVPAIERKTMTGRGCSTTGEGTSEVSSEQSHRWVRREQRRPILPVSEMLDDAGCQEISGDGDFACGDDTEARRTGTQLARGSIRGEEHFARLKKDAQ